MRDDVMLQELLIARRQMMQDLAPVLARVGAFHPQRAKVNKARAGKRKRLKKALRMNADAIASRCIVLMEIIHAPEGP